MSFSQCPPTTLLQRWLEEPFNYSALCSLGIEELPVGQHLMGKKHMHKQFGNCYISNAYTVCIQEEHSAGSIYICMLYARSPAKHNFSSGSQQPGSQGYFCLSKEQSAFKAPFEYMFVCVLFMSLCINVHVHFPGSVFVWSQASACGFALLPLRPCL